MAAAVPILLLALPLVALVVVVLVLLVLVLVLLRAVLRGLLPTFQFYVVVMCHLQQVLADGCLDCRLTAVLF